MNGSIALNDTVRFDIDGDRTVLLDPYRLYNLDVFEYQVNNT
jgi:hypothetical protein